MFQFRVRPWMLAKISRQLFGAPRFRFTLLWRILWALWNRRVRAHLPVDVGVFCCARTGEFRFRVRQCHPTNAGEIIDEAYFQRGEKPYDFPTVQWHYGEFFTNQDQSDGSLWFRAVGEFVSWVKEQECSPMALKTFSERLPEVVLALKDISDVYKFGCQEEFFRCLFSSTKYPDVDEFLLDQLAAEILQCKAV